MNKKLSQHKLWFAHGFLMILLCIAWFQFNATINNNNDCAQGLNYIEYLNSSVQRLAKLEMLETPNDELAHHLNNVIFKLESDSIYGSNSTVDRTVTETLVSDIKSNWKSLYEEIEQARARGDNSELLFASERFYNTAIQLNTETSTQFMDMSNQLVRIQVFIIFVICLMMAIIFFNIYKTFKELRQTKLLSEKMSIDTCTGLYNRSKCQEILKNTITPSNLKSRIMIMIDLNDLKLANDNYGHQVGDELIANFANILKDATKIHSFEIFVGRYGGDEFMVYYPSADESDALLYIEEINYLSSQFNLGAEKCKISFATGYAVFGENRSDATMRDLFDEADANMYENKAKFKKQRLENSRNQGYKNEILSDKRLISSADKTNKGDNK